MTLNQQFVLVCVDKAKRRNTCVQTTDVKTFTFGPDSLRAPPVVVDGSEAGPFFYLLFFFFFLFLLRLLFFTHFGDNPE